MVLGLGFRILNCLGSSDPSGFGFRLKDPWGLGSTVNPIKLETGLRPNSARIPYALLLGIEAMGFPTFLASSVGVL